MAAPCCISGHLHEGSPEGTEAEIAGFKTYIAAPADGSKDYALLYIHDIFGYELKNSRLLADEYAKAGFYVYIPDLLDGDALPSNLLRPLAPTTTQMEGKTEEELGQDKAMVYETLGPWAEKHHPKMEYPKIQTFVKHLRSDKSHKFVGAVGLCWGGCGAIYLSQAGADPTVDVGVALHPSMADVPEDYEKIAKPFSVQIGDLDDVFPPPDQQKVAEIFKNKKDCEIVFHEGQVHGFGNRGDLTIEKDKKAKEVCAENTINFLKLHMK